MPRNNDPEVGEIKVFWVPISNGALFAPTLPISDQQGSPGAGNGESLAARAIARHAVVHGRPAGVVVRFARPLWNCTVPAARMVIVSPLFTVRPVSVNVCFEGTVTGMGFAAMPLARAAAAGGARTKQVVAAPARAQVARLIFI